MWTLAALGFAAPALLAGTLFIGLPLLAHFLNRKVRTRIVFPSLRLLADARVSRERFGTWRKWLLFLLRALALACIAAAFARPYWSRIPQAREIPPEEGSGSTLVLLDASLSMTRLVGNTSAWEHALRAADEVLDTAARRNRRLQILPADAAPAPLFPRFTLNHEALRAELRALQPSAARADLPAALALAARLLQEQPAPRSLVILTDAQHSNWADLLQASLPRLPADTTLTLLQTPEQPTRNLSVHTPTLTPAHPLRQEPARISAFLQNHGTSPAQTTLTLRINDLPTHQETLHLAPGETREWSHTHTFDTHGLQHITLELPPDEFAADNLARIALRVYDRPAVLILSQENPHQPGTATFHLLRALAPHGDPSDRWQPRLLLPGELSAGTLANVEVVWTVEPLPLTPAERNRLAAHAETGGWIQLGNPDPAASLQSAPATTPFRLREDRDAAELLPTFDPAARNALARIPFTRRHLLPPAEPHRTALRFHDGPPALRWTDTPGGGRILQTAFTPARDHGTLAAAPIWVALVHALMNGMPGRTLPAPAPIAGDPLHLLTHAYQPGQGEPILRTPDGSRLPEPVFLLEGDTLSGLIPTAHQIGFYTLHQGSTLLDRVAVNPDPRESDFQTLPLDTLSAHLLTAAPAHTVLADTATPATDLFPADGRPLWGWALLAALLLLILESTLLLRWRT